MIRATSGRDTSLTGLPDTIFRAACTPGEGQEFVTNHDPVSSRARRVPRIETCTCLVCGFDPVYRLGFHPLLRDQISRL